MSLAAVTASNAAPARTQEPARETTGRGAGSKFADLLGTLEHETLKVEASSKVASADGTNAPPAAASPEVAKASGLAALEAALAGLANGALGGAKTALPVPSASPKATSGGATNAATKWRATPKSDATFAAASPAVIGAASVAANALAGVANASSTAAKGRTDDLKPDSVAAGAPDAAGLTALVASGLGAPVVAAFASAATAPAAATIAAPAATAPRNTNDSAGDASPGATSPLPGAALAKSAAADSAASTLRDILGGDSSLFVSSVESRTFLGLDVASSAMAPIAAAAVAATGAVASQGTASGSSTPASESAPATGKRLGASGGAPARVLAAPAVAGGTAGAAAGKSSSAKSGDSSAGDASSGSAAPSPAAAASASATSAASDLVGGFSASVSLDQLPAVIADAVDDLSAAAQGASDPAAVGASKAQPVKELQINLAPAELGSLQVTMRLVDGKLSIVVEVAKTSTLQAIAGDRDAIAARLGSASTPLESLIVQPMRADTAAGADSNGDAQSGTQDNPPHGANRDSPAGGQSTAQRDGAADAFRRQSASARRSAGDLTV